MLLDDLQELARKEILDLIERLLLEADLESELAKLEVYGKNLDGIKDFLKHLLIDQNTGDKTHNEVNISLNSAYLQEKPLRGKLHSCSTLKRLSIRQCLA